MQHGSLRLGTPVAERGGTQVTDPNGEVVHAHGGGVVKADGYYYWFGENRSDDNTFRYVSAYRSKDLKTWEFRRHVLTQKTDPELESANIERPKVMYNKATGTFVMWMHKENASDYGEARAAVAVSGTVDGDYAWQGQSREAPALFKRDGVYFLLTSGATGWGPNQQKYATSTSLDSGWSEMRDIGDATAYGSQTAYVLPVQGSSGTSYLYMGDRWAGAWNGPVKDSQYVWLPLDFPDKTTMTMDWAEEITLDTETGTIDP